MVVFICALVACLASLCSAYYAPGLDEYAIGKNYTCNYAASNEFTCFAGDAAYSFIGPEPYDDVGSASWWLHLLFAVLLIGVSALMAVLMRSYFTQDVMALKVQMSGGSAIEQKHATMIYPIVQKHYLLLATLLIAPCITSEWLPLFLTRLFPEWLSILISVLCIYFFASILPQALGKRVRFSLAYYFSFLTYALMGILFIIAFPFAKLFEILIGHEEQTYFKRSELKELFDQHGKTAAVEEATGNKGSGLSDVELRIIRGALNLREKKCNSDQIYTPLDKVFMLPLTAVINQETRDKIIKEGHSRIPVYLKQPHNMIGLALTKTLLALDPQLNTPLANVDLCQVGKVTSETPLYTLLNQFTNAKKGKNPNQTMKNKNLHLLSKEKKYNRSHMAIVLDAADNLTVLGVVTLEDVIEELLETEVWDEKDFPRIPKRPELQDILSPSARDSPVSSVHYKEAFSAKISTPPTKRLDERNPLFSSAGGVESSTGATSTKSSNTYKYYGSVDEKKEI